MGADVVDDIFDHRKISAAVKLFQPYKSPGGDGVYPIILQSTWEIIGPILRTIMIASFTFGCIPSSWLNSKGVFLPKLGKASYRKVKSFRLVTLTSVQLKIMERVIYWFMEKKITSLSLLHVNQFGFTRGKSTDTALHELVMRIEEAIINKKFALGIFLDIEGAFDNVPFEVINHSLAQFNFPGAVQRWIDYILRRRLLEFSLNDVTIVKNPKKGFPQGGFFLPYYGYLS